MLLLCSQLARILKVLAHIFQSTFAIQSILAGLPLAKHAVLTCMAKRRQNLESVSDDRAPAAGARQGKDKDPHLNKSNA